MGSMSMVAVVLFVGVVCFGLDLDYSQERRVQSETERKCLSFRPLTKRKRVETNGLRPPQSSQIPVSFCFVSRATCQDVKLP